MCPFPLVLLSLFAFLQCAFPISVYMYICHSVFVTGHTTACYELTRTFLLEGWKILAKFMGHKMLSELTLLLTKYLRKCLKAYYFPIIIILSRLNIMFHLRLFILMSSLTKINIATTPFPFSICHILNTITFDLNRHWILEVNFL